MNALRRWLLGASILAAFAVTPGCSNALEEEEEEDEGALGAEDSGKLVATTQTDLLIYQGYNTLFDQGHNGCVTFPAALSTQVGDVGVDVKVSLVKSREELAKQLGFDTDLAFKVPKAGADARADVMNSFKRNSTSTTLLVRVGTYYVIDGGQNFNLTAEAKGLLRSDPRGFLQRCGDAAVTRLQYRAEVIGLMKFNSNDQEKATKAGGQVGVEAPAVGTIADAKVKVGATYNSMKSATNASMELELHTQGFVPGGDIPTQQLEGDAAMARLNDMIGKMGESIRADRKRDVEAIAAGKIPTIPAGSEAQNIPGRTTIERNAKLGAITFHAYSKKESSSMAGVTQLTQDASRFLLEVGDIQGRLENTYFEEVNAFTTSSDHETYNLLSKAAASSAELEPVAQKWSGLIKPTPGSGTVAGKLKDAQLDCVRMAIAGDHTKCVKTAEISKLIADGNKQLDEYTATGRVVRMNVLNSGASQTAKQAQAACAKSGGRLPADTEMEWLRPALAAKGGSVWVTSDSCSQKVGIYTGKQAPSCYNGWFIDWVDNTIDALGGANKSAPVYCVANVGPRPVLGRPGE